MRLKSVELFGFKSFPDRTVIEFGAGITAILGPNGCGKSNVVDAIKWVLGEKSAKNLRGEEMLDVIFSGCESRSASGMAEVKLVFDNTDGKLPLPYNEVAVGRRIYRSRESEYFINKNRCRLKDIRDLFLDTGVGSSAYSVIEQGRVEALLHAKPADRRAVFEEAAGIAKFKARRKEILSRLERTDQILLRVNDRVEEKERQIRKVAAQAANARRHRRLTTERDSAREHLYRRQFAEQHRLLAQFGKQKEALESEIDREEQTQAALAAEILALTTQEGELSLNRDAVVEAAGMTQEELSAVLLEQANTQSRHDTLVQEVSRGNERKNELSARLERLTQQEREARERLQEEEARAASLEERFTTQDRDRQDLAKAAADAEARVTELRTQMIDCNRRRQELSSEAARLETAEQSSSARLAEVSARLEKIAADETTLAAAVQSLESEYARAASSFGASADQLEALRGESRGLQGEMERLQSEERSAESERSAKASRKATLEDLEHSFDGAYEGVKNILTAARDGSFASRGVVGMAIDLMTVPQDVALAVETILGASAQDVVMETARDAQAAIEHLKRFRLGRATFLPMDRIQPRRKLTQSFRHIPGVIGEAVDLVTFDRRHQVVMEYLLNGILVVDSLELARELSGREARGVRIVTLEGDVINPSGSMTGGHGKQRRAGLVQRKAELDALAADLAECEQRLAEKQRRRTEAAERLREVAARADDLEKALAEAGRAEAQFKQNLAVRKNELERLSRDRAETESEHAAVASGGGERRERLLRLQRELEESAADMAGLEQRVLDGTEEQRRTRETIDALGQEFAALSGERSDALARVRELTSRIAEMATEMMGCRDELAKPGITSAEADAELATLRERLESLRAKEAELLRVRDERRAAGVELAERLTECRNQAEELRRRERESQGQATRVREGMAQLDRQSAECEFRIATVLEKARDELQIEDLSLPEHTEAEAPSSIEDLLEDGLAAPSAPVAEEEKSEPEPEWMQLPDGELQRHIEDLSQKIRNIGSVNLEAIDELAELEAGAEFLRSHQEEQQEAVDAMRAAIDKLNEESSTRFQETFVAVRESFQQMFTRLFGGGKADLFLEEVTEPGADPLDAGIDIRAQPPGKEPKSISLLSGGEKALCAVALLFALFRSKPSPFCILDEVDGPLDESNIDRFMQQVKDYTDETQFIIITHSQRTMGMTDEIWGVTQKVPGISSIHSLKFDAMESMSGEKPGPVEVASIEREFEATSA